MADGVDGPAVGSMTCWIAVDVWESELIRSAPCVIRGGAGETAMESNFSCRLATGGAPGAAMEDRR
jgi:hypothetical protein